MTPANHEALGESGGARGRESCNDENSSSEMGRRPRNHVSQVKAAKFIHRTRHIAGATPPPSPPPSTDVTAKVVGRLSTAPCMDGAIAASNIAETTAERRPGASEQQNCQPLRRKNENFRRFVQAKQRRRASPTLQPTDSPTRQPDDHREVQAETSSSPQEVAQVDCQDIRQEETKSESNADNKYRFEFAPSMTPRRPAASNDFDRTVDLSTEKEQQSLGSDDTSDCRSCLSDESPTSISVDISNLAAANKKKPKRYSYIRVEHNLRNVKGIIQQPERMKRQKKLSWHDDAENRDKPFVLKSDVSFDVSTLTWDFTNAVESGCAYTCGRSASKKQSRRVWNSSLDSFDTLSVDSADWDTFLAQLAYRKNKYQETVRGYVSRARENIGRSISIAAGKQHGEAAKGEYDSSYLSFFDVTDTTTCSIGDRVEPTNEGPQSEKEKMSALLEISILDLLDRSSE